MRSFEHIKLPAATLTTMLALGGLSYNAARAEAAPAAKDTIHHIDKSHPPLKGPPGVKNVGESGYEQDITAEAQEALKHINKRYEGILLLHQSKTLNHVDMTESPTSYNIPETTDVNTFTEKTDDDYLWLYKPYLLDFKGRTYAAIFDGNTYHWAFVDLAWARDNGALTPLAIKGLKTRTVPFRFGESSTDMPGYVFGSAGDPTRGWMPNPNDPANKRVSYNPTKVMPPIKTKEHRLYKH